MEIFHSDVKCHQSNMTTLIGRKLNYWLTLLHVKFIHLKQSCANAHLNKNSSALHYLDIAIEFQIWGGENYKGNKKIYIRLGKIIFFKCELRGHGSFVSGILRKKRIQNY